jgi:hypothetical protein
MRLLLKDIAGIAKFSLGVLSIFLILFGIHWILILSGIVLGALYYAIPKRYLN